MARKEDIKRIHEMIKEIAPSTSMGDFGLKEQLCIELLKWKEEQLIEKSCEWLKANINNYLVRGRDIDYLFDDYKKAMEE